MIYVALAMAAVIVYIQEVRIRMALSDKKDYQGLIDRYIRESKESESDDE